MFIAMIKGTIEQAIEAASERGFTVRGVQIDTLDGRRDTILTLEGEQSGMVKWFVEDNGNAAPYAEGSLLFYRDCANIKGTVGLG